MAKDTILRVRLEDSEWEKLGDLADSLGIKKSTLVRRLVNFAQVSDKPRLEVHDLGLAQDQYAETR